MNKKGFTLVELLAVITLIAAIILVSVPSIINTLRSSEEREYQDFKNALIQAAELYIERNRDLYPELGSVGESVEIDAQTLIENGYLKQDLKNPNDDSSVVDYTVSVEVGSDEIFIYTVEGK